MRIAEMMGGGIATDGVGDQGAEDAFIWGAERTNRSVLKAMPSVRATILSARRFAAAWGNFLPHSRGFPRVEVHPLPEGE